MTTTKNALIAAAGLGMIAGAVLYATAPMALASVSLILNTDATRAQGATINSLDDGGYRITLYVEADRLWPDGGVEDVKKCNTDVQLGAAQQSALTSFMRGQVLPLAKAQCGW